MERRFSLECYLDAPIEAVWAALQRPALLNHVAAPLLDFRPIDPDHFPARWQPGEYRVSMRVFGIIPIGWQIIGIALPADPDGGHWLHDKGRSPLLRHWDHRITLEASGTGTRYRDEIILDAGAITPLALPMVALFFRHRQRRWRTLVAKGLTESAID